MSTSHSEKEKVDHNLSSRIKQLKIHKEKLIIVWDVNLIWLENNNSEEGTYFRFQTFVFGGQKLKVTGRSHEVIWRSHLLFQHLYIVY